MMRDTKETNKFAIVKSKEERELSKKDLAEKYTIKERIENLSISSILDMVDKRFRVRLFSTSKFIKKDYINDKDGLVQAFYDKGYRDASIVSDSVYNEDDNSLKINITIDEGVKYYFRSVEFRGNTKYKTEDLKRVVGIRRGDVYNNSLLETRLRMDPSGQDVSSLYMDDGYLFFNLQQEEIVTHGDSVDVIVNIYEGTQATVDRIIITGNSKTKESVIRREIRTKPGSKFSRSDIIRTQRDLAALGFFDPERIEILPKPHPEKGTVEKQRPA
jgi:outer membrane protein insertion porin family